VTGLLAVLVVTAGEGIAPTERELVQTMISMCQTVVGMLVTYGVVSRGTARRVEQTSRATARVLGHVENDHVLPLRDDLDAKCSALERTLALVVDLARATHEDVTAIRADAAQDRDRVHDLARRLEQTTTRRPAHARPGAP